MKYLSMIFLGLTVLFLSSCGGGDDEMPDEEMPVVPVAEFEVEIDGVPYAYTELIEGGSPSGDAMITAKKGLLDFLILTFEKDIAPGQYTTTGTISAAVSYRLESEAFVWQAQSGTINITENDVTNGAIKGTIDNATLFEITQFEEEVSITNCKFTITYTP